MKERTVTVLNHGCKLNQFEGEAIAHSFKKAGFKVVDIRSGADVIVVNTCTVTEKSDRKSRNTIFKASRIKPPGGLLVVTGCYAETDPDDLESIEGVDFVVGTGEKPRICDIVLASFQGKKVEKAEQVPISPFQYADVEYPERSRVFVKVQDGCSESCSYCKVPLARGKSKSRDYNEISSYMEKVSKNGYREIVLTGINLGDYRYNGVTLVGLLSRLLENVKDYRIRLSSIEPMFYNDEIFNIINDERIVPHFHLPLQSGSDRILRLMNRPYKVKDFFMITERLKAVRPECHIATDVIVGFPSETEKDHRSTVKMIEDVGFASLHVFKYSKRRGTKAAAMGDDVPYGKKAQRSRELIQMGEMLNYQYRRRFFEARLPAVIERRNGGLQGVTHNYIKVRIERPLFDIDFNRKIVPLEITRVEKDATFGILCPA